MKTKNVTKHLLAIALLSHIWNKIRFGSLGHSSPRCIRKVDLVLDTTQWQFHSSSCVSFLLVVRGPTDSLFWSALFISPWTGCPIPFFQNSNNLDLKRSVLLPASFVYRFEIKFRCVDLAERWLSVAQVVTAVLWNKSDSLFYVPVWIIILSVLAGLLLLALLIFLLYKVIIFTNHIWGEVFVFRVQNRHSFLCGLSTQFSRSPHLCSDMIFVLSWHIWNIF